MVPFDRYSWTLVPGADLPPAASSTHEGFFAEAIVTVPSALSAIAQRWARRYIERGIAGQGAFNGEVAVEFGWFRVGFCLRIVSLEVELRQPPVARDICNVRYGRECDSAVGCAPFPLVHRVRHERVLYPRDARWEAAVVGIDGKTGLLCIQVLLDALGVGGSPLVGLAVLDEVIVFEAR